MTVEEKRKELNAFCNSYPGDEFGSPCDGCIFHNEKSWCEKYGSYDDIPEEECDKALELIEKEHRRSSPYWDNIASIARKQRAKGMETYGQGLEDNDKPTIERIQYIEEELVDALMYLEWLKEKIKDE